MKGKRKRGIQKKRWDNNIKKCAIHLAAENRTRWKGIVANSSVVPRRPSKVMGYDRKAKEVFFPTVTASSIFFLMLLSVAFFNRQGFG